MATTTREIWLDSLIHPVTVHQGLGSAPHASIAMLPGRTIVVL